MKELVIKIAQDYLTWIALGVALGGGAYVLFKDRSAGKAGSFAIGALLFAFVCYYPELVLTKVFDFMAMVLKFLKIS